MRGLTAFSCPMNGSLGDRDNLLAAGERVDPIPQNMSRQVNRGAKKWSQKFSGPQRCRRYLWAVNALFSLANYRGNRGRSGA